MVMSSCTVLLPSKTRHIGKRFSVCQIRQGVKACQDTLLLGFYAFGGILSGHLYRRRKSWPKFTRNGTAGTSSNSA